MGWNAVPQILEIWLASWFRRTSIQLVSMKFNKFPFKTNLKNILKMSPQLIFIWSETGQVFAVSGRWAKRRRKMVPNDRCFRLVLQRFPERSKEKKTSSRLSRQFYDIFRTWDGKDWATNHCLCELVPFAVIEISNPCWKTYMEGLFCSMNTPKPLKTI